MLGLCVAAFSENRYVVAAVPFFINRIFLYLGDMIDWLSIVSPYSYQQYSFGIPVRRWIFSGWLLKIGSNVFIYLYFYRGNEMRSLHG